MSDDLIRREDAIKAIKQWRDNDGSLFDVGLNQAIREIKRLPSADRPQGEWVVTQENGTHNYIYRCSVCEWYEYHAYPDVKGHNYCPNCGAKMKGADDD